MSNWYFHYQVNGKEDKWDLSIASERDRIISEVRPMFTTVLDMTGVPEDGDWGKVRYLGPYYVDFDADGDIEFAVSQCMAFLFKLEDELGMALDQIRIYASGAKGFHLEIPAACFEVKPLKTGHQWLPYIYREISRTLYVDSLDLNVYTGKRGRMWRTEGVKRENGNYKVALHLSELEGMTEEIYFDLVSKPRPSIVPAAPTLNAKLANIFDNAKERVLTLGRSRTKRKAASNEALDRWRKANQHPPMILKIMDGTGLVEGKGFQSIAMQLSIYATSVSMAKSEFLSRCDGLVQNHVSDGTRYNTPSKRRAELERMWDYMQDNSLYEFEVQPIVSLLKPSEVSGDFGPIEVKEEVKQSDDSGEGARNDVAFDPHSGLRRGFFMNDDGMFRRTKDFTESICRGTLKNIEIIEPLPQLRTELGMDGMAFFAFDLVAKGKTRRITVSQDVFTSANKFKSLMAAYQLAFQGNDSDVSAMLDIITNGKEVLRNTFVYPREGLFVIQNPMRTDRAPVVVYLTQDTFINSLPEDDPYYFKLRYRPAHATSSYNIDIHTAPDLDKSMAPHFHNLFNLNSPKVLADVIGWFVAAHYRSLYLHFFGQFPALHIWGEAGAGKSKSVEIMARMHWHHRHKIQIKSALSSTNLALDVDASSSTSCPMIIDEWKPKELRSIRGRYEKLKDVIKANYIGSDIGNRGTINKGAESSVGVIKTKATAPICFMAEAIESETAIFERCVIVTLKQDLHKLVPMRTEAFHALYESDEASSALSALGKQILRMGLSIDLDKFRDEFVEIRNGVRKKVEGMGTDEQRKAASRMINNRAVILHALSIFKRVMATAFDDTFDKHIEEMANARSDALIGDEGAVMTMQGMSEISKVLSRIAALSRAKDEPYEMKKGIDYTTGDGWVEIRVENAYDKYRRYCQSIGDAPLFPYMDSFVYALSNYSATIDVLCSDSEIRPEGSNERIYRIDTVRTTREGVQTFRS